MTNTQNTPPATTGSAVIAALESVWEAIRANHPELPEVVIITGSGRLLAGLKWGHFCNDVWSNGRFRVDSNGTIERDRKPELFVGGEQLGVGAAETVETMLHEAAHALAAVRKIKDTSRQNRYHNRRFLELVRELGLEYEGDPHKVLGFSEAKLTEATRKEYGQVIEVLQNAIQLSMDLPSWVRLTGGSGGAGGDGTTGRPPKRPTQNRNNVKAKCGCDRIIRVSRSVLEQAPITCGQCGDEFLAADGVG